MLISRFVRRFVASLVFALPLVTVLPSLVPLAAAAQDRGPVNRTLQGTVEDKNGAPVKGAVVYLKDTRTSTIKSAVAEDNGTYRFVQLAQGTDYEVWAKLGDNRGPSKSISSFDSKAQLVINLKVN